MIVIYGESLLRYLFVAFTNKIILIGLFYGQIMKIINCLSYPLTTIVLLFGGTFFIDAYAYIDPGSGSMFIQVIVGALVGVGIAMKMYWAKIRFKISMMRANKSKNE